mmetsp:Transcript_11497/g.23823  ORF Transcript_11497/g.23823 Transcript_11497/m.23823 type:complete len:304 (-) Transcript_11497:351-1262(-)
MAVMSVLRVTLAVACAQFVLASSPTGLRGAVTNETHAGRPEEAEQIEELSGGVDVPSGAQNESTVALESSASANLTVQAAWGVPAWCLWTPWLCKAPAPAPATAPHRHDGHHGHHGHDDGGASCAAYHCGGYRPNLACQCNSACARHGNCCHDYWQRCTRPPVPAPAPRPPHAPAPAPAAAPSHGGKIMTLYHQTSPELAALILQSGFKPGSSGWCGGGIYFATTPQATYTKAIGPDSHQGFIIEARVNVGRVLHMSKTCDRSMTGQKLWSQHYDSITFNPGDGEEYVVYSKDRVVSMKKYSR